MSEALYDARMGLNEDEMTLYCGCRVWHDERGIYLRHCSLHRAGTDMLGALGHALDEIDTAILDASHRPNKEVRNSVLAALTRATAKQE